MGIAKMDTRRRQSRILVTGGAGFIGSHTVVELQQCGYSVVIVDNLSNSRADVVDRIAKITGVRPEFHEFDLTDRAKTEAFFASASDLDAVIHFAAFKAVGESVRDPLAYYRNNSGIALRVLEACAATDTKPGVSSSATVYGQPDELPVRETSSSRKPGPLREHQADGRGDPPVFGCGVRAACHRPEVFQPRGGAIGP